MGGNWDYNHPDVIWPGIFGYLIERNYDISRVGIKTHSPAADKNVILESKVENTEEGKYLKYCLLSKELRRLR